MLCLLRHANLRSLHYLAPLLLQHIHCYPLLFTAIHCYSL